MQHDFERLIEPKRRIHLILSQKHVPSGPLEFITLDQEKWKQNPTIGHGFPGAKYIYTVIILTIFSNININLLTEHRGTTCNVEQSIKVISYYDLKAKLYLTKGSRWVCKAGGESHRTHTLHVEIKRCCSSFTGTSFRHIIYTPNYNR